MTGPPCSICERKIGTTLPDEPSTLPKRTITKRVVAWRWPAAATIHSAIAFEAPITVCGLTALSVETSTNRLTPAAAAVSAVTLVAIALLRIASSGFVSISGDVLVGGGVEDDVGLEPLHHLEHAVALLAVGEHRLDAA